MNYDNLPSIFLLFGNSGHSRSSFGHAVDSQIERLDAAIRLGREGRTVDGQMDPLG